MAKKQKVEIQSNGRVYVSGVWLTPTQAKGLAACLRVHIPQYEATHIINKPTPSQKNYLEALYSRLEAAELAATLEEVKEAKK